MNFRKVSNLQEVFTIQSPFPSYCEHEVPKLSNVANHSSVLMYSRHSQVLSLLDDEFVHFKEQLYYNFDTLVIVIIHEPFIFTPPSTR